MENYCFNSSGLGPSLGNDDEDDTRTFGFRYVSQDESSNYTPYALGPEHDSDEFDCSEEQESATLSKRNSNREGLIWSDSDESDESLASDDKPFAGVDWNSVYQTNWEALARAKQERPNHASGEKRPANQTSQLNSVAPSTATETTTATTTTKTADASNPDDLNSLLRESWTLPSRANSNRSSSLQSSGPLGSVNAYLALSTVIEEFVAVARSYAKVLIIERHLPASLKSIKPFESAGFAGGDKFSAQGIFFKFCTNSSGLYGSEHNAQKIGAHELKGVAGLTRATMDQNANSSHPMAFPLMALFKYLGHCVLAMTQLPITKSTLVYGSNDGGKTMNTSVPKLNEMMKKAAESLNLRDCLMSGHTIYGPGDIEGHMASDGRFYILDFARVFPPQGQMPIQLAPDSEDLAIADSMRINALNKIARMNGLASMADNPNSQLQSGSQPSGIIDAHSTSSTSSSTTTTRSLANHSPATSSSSISAYPTFPGRRIWYQLLRPELVRAWPEPLASNGFSGFLSGDPRRAEMNASLSACTRYLVRVRVLEFVDFIKSGWLSTEAQLIHFLHRHGINIRFLGLVCSHLREAEIGKGLTNDAGSNKSDPNSAYLVTSSNTLALCFTEVWARVLKNVTRARWRENTRRSCVLQQCVKTCVQLANHVIARNRNILTQLVEEAAKSFPFLFCCNANERDAALLRGMNDESSELGLNLSSKYGTAKSYSTSNSTPTSATDGAYLSQGLSLLLSHLDSHCGSVLRRYAFLCGFKFTCLEGGMRTMGINDLPPSNSVPSLIFPHDVTAMEALVKLPDEAETITCLALLYTCRREIRLIPLSGEEKGGGDLKRSEQNLSRLINLDSVISRLLQLSTSLSVFATKEFTRFIHEARVRYCALHEGLRRRQISRVEFLEYKMIRQLGRKLCSLALYCDPHDHALQVDNAYFNDFRFHTLSKQYLGSIGPSDATISIESAMSHYLVYKLTRFASSVDLIDRLMLYFTAIPKLQISSDSDCLRSYLFCLLIRLNARVNAIAGLFSNGSQANAISKVNEESQEIDEIMWALEYYHSTYESTDGSKPLWKRLFKPYWISKKSAVVLYRSAHFYHAISAPVPFFALVRALHLDHVLTLADADLELISRLSPHLVSLAISRAQRITDEGTAKCLAILTQLENLSLLSCPLLKEPLVNFRQARDAADSTTVPISASFSLTISADLIRPSLLHTFVNLNRLILHNLPPNDAPSPLVPRRQQPRNILSQETPSSDSIPPTCGNYDNPQPIALALPFNARVRASYDGGLRYYDGLFRGCLGGGAVPMSVDTSPFKPPDNFVDEPAPPVAPEVVYESGREEYGIQFDNGLFAMNVKRNQFYALRDGALPDYQIGDIVLAKNWTRKMFGWIQEINPTTGEYSIRTLTQLGMGWVKPTAMIRVWPLTAGDLELIEFDYPSADGIVAFLMAKHPRLGAHSPARILPIELMRQLMTCQDYWKRVPKVNELWNVYTDKGDGLPQLYRGCVTSVRPAEGECDLHMSHFDFKGQQRVFRFNELKPLFHYLQYYGETSRYNRFRLFSREEMDIPTYHAKDALLVRRNGVWVPAQFSSSIGSYNPINYDRVAALSQFVITVTLDAPHSVINCDNSEEKYCVVDVLPATGFYVGQRVESLYKNRDDAWFEGTILSIQRDKYTIQYDDGMIASEVAMGCVRPMHMKRHPRKYMLGFTEGQRVLVSQQGRWLECTIVMLQGAVVTVCPLGLDEEGHISVNLTHEPRRIALQYQFVAEEDKKSKKSGKLNTSLDARRKLQHDVLNSGIDSDSVARLMALTSSLSLVNSAPPLILCTSLETCLFPRLKRLDLLNTPITLAGLIALIDNCSFLKTLSLLHTAQSVNNSWSNRAEFLHTLCQSEHLCFLSHPHLREIRLSEQLCFQFSGNKSRRFEICHRSLLHGYIYELSHTKVNTTPNANSFPASSMKCGMIQSFRISNNLDHCQTLSCGLLSVPFHNDPSGAESMCEGGTIGVSRAPIIFALPTPVVSAPILRRDASEQQARDNSNPVTNDEGILSSPSAAVTDSKPNSATTNASTLPSPTEQPRHAVVPVEIGRSVKFSNPNFYSILGIAMCKRMDSVMLDFAQHRRLVMFDKRFCFEDDFSGDFDNLDQEDEFTTLPRRTATDQSENRKRACGSIVRVPRRCNLTIFLPLLVFVFYDRIDQQRF